MFVNLTLHNGIVHNACSNNRQQVHIGKLKVGYLFSMYKLFTILD